MHSPFRIQYGTNNPAVRGIVITSHSVIPNFSWTPRLALESDALEEVLAHPDWHDHPSMLMVPAVHGRTVRIFAHASMWYIANNQRVEPLVAIAKRTERSAMSALATMFMCCLEQYYPGHVAKFVHELNPHQRFAYGPWPMACKPLRVAGTLLVLCHVSRTTGPVVPVTEPYLWTQAHKWYGSEIRALVRC